MSTGLQAIQLRHITRGRVGDINAPKRRAHGAQGEHLIISCPYVQRAGAVARENWRTSAWGRTQHTDPLDPHED
jgi:hypothetical protein